ncbi:MAG TPA: lamin tail domain-containing protein [Candidatus Paceibacterota bacterium]|nr:lamin tail domain-containing protein [Verrucomicrobiota bacterium]HRY48213.1 lamin tail domain-containing protein [Candidatus Paceibacterota bacterium]HSA01411.1 lamin tail domain-containing protein [Candidatus Paceibacterota bacterium]
MIPFLSRGGQGILLVCLLIADLSAAVRIHEFMAINRGAVVDPYGGNADWFELYNDGTSRVDLSDYGISLDPSKTNRWRIPSGTSLAGRSFLVVWCDGSRSPSAKAGAVLNTGQALPGEGGGIALFSPAGAALDSVEYGFQIEDVSLGWVRNSWEPLSSATPGKANSLPRDVDAPAGLRFNEWLADPASGSDWFEIHNPGQRPVSLGGCWLTNATPVAGAALFPISRFSYIDAGGWVLFYADKKTNSGKNHVTFNLSKAGGMLLLYDPDGKPVDQVTYDSQEEDVSEGWLPDGGDHRVRFRDTVTPGQANYLLMTNLWINEILAHTDPPWEDAIEIYNPSPVRIDISGWFLSNGPNQPQKYRIPEGSVLLPYGFTVLYEYQFRGTNDFTFNSAHGDEVVLSETDAEGRLTGYRIQVEFGSTENGVSLGRFETSQGVDWVAQTTPSFGVANPTSLSDFRKGTGQPNPYPRIGPVVINEVMYHPPDAWATNETANMNYEYVELLNVGASSVALYDPEHPENTWRVEGEIRWFFPEKNTIRGGEYLILVGFDPEQDAQLTASFRARYPQLPNAARLLGPYEGRLSNSGGRLSLYKPDPPQEPPHPDAGYIPYILVDQVRFQDQSPWPASADGGGNSLQRRVPGDYGDDVVNWLANLPTPGLDNRIETSDQDGDGMPDSWELAHSFNPQDSSDALLDTDLDGLDNYEEYLCGTDPRQAGDHLDFSAIFVEPEWIALHFSARAQHTYTVEYCDGGKTWQWRKLIDLGARPIDEPAVLQDRLTPEGRGRFYRLITPRVP